MPYRGEVEMWQQIGQIARAASNIAACLQAYELRQREKPKHMPILVDGHVVVCKCGHNTPYEQVAADMWKHYEDHKSVAAKEDRDRGEHPAPVE